ncbi:MAG: protein kinase [bacterium]|nr:protein kinase [bacterium]
MNSDEMEELLVDWELARQQGRALSSSELCADQELQGALETQIEILKKTEWMLKDPVGNPASSKESKDVSQLSEAMVAPDAAGLQPSQPVADADQQESRTILADDCAEQAEQTLLIRALESQGSRPEMADAANPKNRFQSPPLPDTSSREYISSQLEKAGFRIEEELGRGSFGVVYRARDEKLRRSVAVKVPFLNNPRTRVRYLQEARNAALVEVPGMIPVLQVGNMEDGTPFVVQKLIVGKTLAQLLSDRDSCDLRTIVSLLCQVCQAVAAAHARSLVHRDLKPANILVDQQGQAWVADFGLAFTEQDLDSGDQSLARIAGTPAYMAPEQMSDRLERLDGRCDIWALGVILYESLTGKRPFRGQSQQELRDQILHHDPRPISQRQPNLAACWNQIFRRCCAKNVAERYASALELAADLQQAAVGLVSGNLGEAITTPDSRQFFSHADSTAGGSSPASQTLLSGSTISTIPPRDQVGRTAVWPFAQVMTWIFSCTALLVAGWFVVQQNWVVAPTEESSPLIDSQSTWTVSPDGSGDFLTLTEAVQAASVRQAPDTPLEIRLLPGEYRESIDMDQNLILRGVGDREQIVIRGQEGPTIRVWQQAELTLDGLTITQAPEEDLQSDGQVSENTSENTIVVQGGKLTLRDCVVEAHGYDCVRIEPDSSLVAEADSVFRASAHPAIYAARAKQLLVRNSKFEFPILRNQESQTRVGIQVRQCGGVVTNCRFGPAPESRERLQGRWLAATGIEWGDTEEPVRIRDCQFEYLGVGLSVFNCASIDVSSATDRSYFLGCRLAVDLTDCDGEITNCEIDGERVSGAVGIQLANRRAEPFEIRDCKVKSTERGLVTSQANVKGSLLSILDSSKDGICALRDSTVDLQQSTIQTVGGLGVLVESSQMTLARVDIEDCGVAAIAVDSFQDAFKMEGSRLERNAIGVLVTSGTVQLDNVEIIQSDTGVLISRKHLLNHSATGDTPMHVAIFGGAIDAKLRAVQFLSPGSLELRECTMNAPASSSISVGEGLEQELVGERLQVRPASRAP